MTEEIPRENKGGTAIFRIDEACYKVSRCIPGLEST